MRETKKLKRERDRERDRETDRQRERETDRELVISKPFPSFCEGYYSSSLQQKKTEVITAQTV